MNQNVEHAPKKAIVIGTGIGGAGVAAQLAQAGFDVTVFERNKFVGGKVAAYERDGFNMDISIHTSPRCEKGPIGDLTRRVHADISWLHQENPLRLIIGNDACIMPMKFYKPRAAINAGRAFKFSINPFKAAGLLRFAWKVVRIRTLKDIERYEGMSAADILKTHIKDKKLHALMDAMACLMMVVSTKEASAADFLWNMANWFKKANTGYPRGGYGRIAHTLADACEQKGGVIKVGEGVERIRVENGRVTGVETKNGFYPADIVVSNAGYRRTVDLAGREHFDSDFVKRVDKLKDSQGAVVVQYAVDKKLIDELVTLYIPDGYNTDTYMESVMRGHDIEPVHLYIVSPTVLDPGLAPEGKHIIYAGTIVPSDLAYKHNTAKVLDMVEETMRKLYPDIEKHTLWKVRRNIDFFASLGGRGAAESIGLAQRFDQDGKNKPDARLPIKGLYAVGADAGGTGIGTELAADSAINVFDMIMKDVMTD